MSESLPDVARRLAELTGRMAQANPGPPSWDLESDREVTGTDDAHHVSVTVANFTVRGVSIDPAWASELLPDVEPIEDAVRQATSDAFSRFLRAELDEAMDTHYGIDGVAAELRQLSVDVSAAFGQHLDSTIGRMPK